MNTKLVSFVLPLLFLCNGAIAQKLTSDIPYVENGHKRHVLDIYTPEKPAGKSLPVMFWIHGGGWQVGDKSDVALKPKVLTDRDFCLCLDELSASAGSENGRADRRRRQVARRTEQPDHDQRAILIHMQAAIICLIARRPDEIKPLEKWLQIPKVLQPMNIGRSDLRRTANRTVA